MHIIDIIIPGIIPISYFVHQIFSLDVGGGEGEDEDDQEPGEAVRDWWDEVFHKRLV